MARALTPAVSIFFKSTQLCDIVCAGMLPMLVNLMRNFSPGFALISRMLNCIWSLPVMLTVRTPSAEVSSPELVEGEGPQAVSPRAAALATVAINKYIFFMICVP